MPSTGRENQRWDRLASISAGGRRSSVGFVVGQGSRVGTGTAVSAGLVVTVGGGLVAGSSVGAAVAVPDGVAVAAGVFVGVEGLVGLLVGTAVGVAGSGESVTAAVERGVVVDGLAAT